MNQNKLVEALEKIESKTDSLVLSNYQILREVKSIAIQALASHNSQQALASYTEDSGWVRVEDRLPEQGKAILMFVDGYVTFGSYGRVNSHTKGKSYFLQSNADWDGGSLPVNPTHWQPLPTPPTTKS